MSFLNLRLTRWGSTPDGTFGRLEVAISGGHWSTAAFTCEDQWRHNLTLKSCIPAGSYELNRTNYNRRNYEVWKIDGVPGRTDILIHKGNDEDDTEGCVLLGVGRGMVDGKWAVTDSRDAFDHFMHSTRDCDRGAIHIRWASND